MEPVETSTCTPGSRRCKAAIRSGRHMCRPILDASDAKGSRDCFASGYRDCFLAKSQQAARVAEQQFALGGEANRMARPDKERLADSALEALDLQAYRRLAACEWIARRCEAAALGYRNKRFEEVWLQSWQFEISMVTLVKIRFDNSCHIASFASSWMSRNARWTRRNRDGRSHQASGRGSPGRIRL